MLGLSHFDEGVYALAGLWSLNPQGITGIDPMVIPYAPPGFPPLVGAAYFLLGVADVSAIVASALCGIVTIPVAGWVGRRSLGVGAGAATAALAAVSMPHIAFSRKALTDVPFGLFWWVAIGLGGRFLERMSLGRAVALGLAVGVAQLFKYNGWLPGIVIATAAGVGLIVNRDERQAWLTGKSIRFTPLLACLIAVGVAWLVYWPWFSFVENHGGYRALMAHHRSYLGGVARWVPYWTQQQAQVVALSGGPAWGAASWGLAWLGCLWSRHGMEIFTGPSLVSNRRAVVVLLGGGLALALVAGFPWWTGLVLVPFLLGSRHPTVRVLGCWWLILAILTPFYHPYARLWLPLHAVGWLLMAGTLVEGLGLAPGAATSPLSLASFSAFARQGLRIGALACLVLGCGLQWSSRARPIPLDDFFRPTAGLRDFVAALPQRIPRSTPPPPLMVLGRRPLAYYLLLQGRYSFGLAQDLDDLERTPEAWAIVDLGLFGSGSDASEFARMKERAVETVNERLDPVTRLDIAPGSALSGSTATGTSLFLLEPAKSLTKTP